MQLCCRHLEAFHNIRIMFKYMTSHGLVEGSKQSYVYAYRSFVPKCRYAHTVSRTSSQLTESCIYSGRYCHPSVHRGLSNIAPKTKYDEDTPSLKTVKSFAATVVNIAPIKLQPYLKIMRIDRPIGTWLLFWPCGWSIAMSAPVGSLPDIHMLLLFGLGAFIMRGAGCTINDLWDRDIDSKVARTKDRPLVSGALTQVEALVLLSGQLGAGLWILLQLNWYSILLGASVVGLVVTYPLMKRFTYWPQLMLGMTINWGALLGWSAVRGCCDWGVCVPLYVAGICWTIFYDTIYAHQDKADDLLLGIKSTAIKFGDDTKLWLGGFGVSMASALTIAGLACDQTWPYYLSVGLVTTHLARQLYLLDIHSAANCSEKFVSNKRVGLLLFGGIVLGGLLRSAEVDKKAVLCLADSKHDPTRTNVTTDTIAL